MGCSNSTAKPAAKTKTEGSPSSAPQPPSTQLNADGKTEATPVVPSGSKEAAVDKSTIEVPAASPSKPVTVALPPAVVEAQSESVTEEKPPVQSWKDVVVGQPSDEHAENVPDVPEASHVVAGAAPGEVANVELNVAQSAPQPSATEHTKKGRGQRKNGKNDRKNKPTEGGKDTHHAKTMHADAPPTTAAPAQPPQTNASKKKRARKPKRDDPTAVVGHDTQNRDHAHEQKSEAAATTTPPKKSTANRSNRNHEKKPSTTAVASDAHVDGAPPVSSAVPTYQDMLMGATASQEGGPNGAPKRKVVFDAETMRKTAPKGNPTTVVNTANLSKKQKEMLKRSHVSAGRRGPVSSKWDKGGKVHMQTDVYMSMAAAFERMLTNAETINAHLDSR